MELLISDRQDPNSHLVSSFSHLGIRKVNREAPSLQNRSSLNSGLASFRKNRSGFRIFTVFEASSNFNCAHLCENRSGASWKSITAAHQLA